FAVGGCSQNLVRKHAQFDDRKINKVKESSILVFSDYISPPSPFVLYYPIQPHCPEFKQYPINEPSWLQSSAPPSTSTPSRAFSSKILSLILPLTRPSSSFLLSILPAHTIRVSLHITSSSGKSSGC